MQIKRHAPAEVRELLQEGGESDGVQSVLPDSHPLTAENENTGTRSIVCSGKNVVCWYILP